MVYFNYGTKANSVNKSRSGVAMFYDGEYEYFTEAEYLDEYAFRSDPTQWKEHYPSDDGYVAYVYSIDQGFAMKERLLEYLAQNLTPYERGKAEYLLRAVERDIRDLKMGYANERS